MTENHPIIPPQELREQWREQWLNAFLPKELGQEDWMINCAAQWGADQELEKCRQWLEINGAPSELIDGLLVARCCSEPPSLKEEALEAFDRIEYAPSEAEDFAIIRRALESIPDPS